MGANENAWSSYMKLKGEIERDLKLVAIPHLSVSYFMWNIIKQAGKMPECDRLSRKRYTFINVFDFVLYSCACLCVLLRVSILIFAKTMAIY